MPCIVGVCGIDDIFNDPLRPAYLIIMYVLNMLYLYLRNYVQGARLIYNWSYLLSPLEFFYASGRTI